MNRKASPKTLFLGSTHSPVWAYLRSSESAVIHTDDPIDPAFLARHQIEFIVSHGYRHILKPPTLNALPDRFVNLHISLLPWNRGADPNLWSFLEDTPKGVTIHYIDEGIDTGDIIAQREIHFDEYETLATSYQTLQDEITQLFIEIWSQIVHRRNHRTPQIGPGSLHRLRDKEPYMHLLTEGWDTPVHKLIGKALQEPTGDKA